MRRVLTAMAVVVLAATACGGDAAAPAPERVLTAAGAASEEAPAPTTTPSPPTTVAPPTTSTTKRPAPATTVKPATATTRVPVTPAPPIAGYSPAPPPPGVQADGYGGYGGVTTVSKGGVAVTLSVYPREQYFGEVVQVGASAGHPAEVAITALTIDFGNGHIIAGPQTQAWGCGTAKDANEGRWYTYPAAGLYRISVTVTFVPCTVLPGPPGGWVLPDGQPAVGMPLPWIASGPPDTVTAGMDMLQRPDRPPRPVGPPPGP